MELKPSLCQQLESRRHRVKTELCDVLAAYPKETENLSKGIDSLAAHNQDSLKRNDQLAPVVNKAMMSMSQR